MHHPLYHPRLEKDSRQEQIIEVSTRSEFKETTRFFFLLTAAAPRTDVLHTSGCAGIYKKRLALFPAIPKICCIDIMESDMPLVLLV
ncbi:hypothetical protein AKJ16_DCAP08560 [Drosera capensis]